LIALAGEVQRAVDAAMEEVEFHKALTAIWDLVKAANRYVEASAPWALARDPAKRERLGTVLYNILEAARICVLLSAPFVPAAAQKMWEALGCPGEAAKAHLADAGKWGGLRAGAALPPSAVAFPRIEE
ncbi:MAG: class I tRNA ligase family protein, partial [Deltaproteobacteria bacterium]|nr:class I tRNA ligase family protein [Candidatus Deferrimicrobiaceae bacterium]